MRWLGGHRIFILQFNSCYVSTASAKHNEHDRANNSHGQETADSHNGDHSGRQSCSLILASSSFWFYKSNETTCQKLVNISLWLHRWYIFSISKGWKTQRKETWQLYSYEVEFLCTSLLGLILRYQLALSIIIICTEPMINLQELGSIMSRSSLKLPNYRHGLFLDFFSREIDKFWSTWARIGEEKK